MTCHTIYTTECNFFLNKASVFTRENQETTKTTPILFLSINTDDVEVLKTSISIKNLVMYVELRHTVEI